MQGKMFTREQIGYGYKAVAEITCGACLSGHFSSRFGPPCLGSLGNCDKLTSAVRFEDTCARPAGLKPPVVPPARMETTPATPTG